MGHVTCVEVRGQLSGVGSLSMMWVPGTELRLSCLQASDLTTEPSLEPLNFISKMVM